METLEAPGEERVPEPSSPFRILLLGDFSGRSRAPNAELATRPVAFDRDDLNAALRAVAPSVRVGFPGADRPEESVRFESLDDFHPDRLFARLDVFGELRRLRRRLASPAGGGSGGAPSSPPRAGNGSRDGAGAGDPGSGASGTADGGNGLLDRIVDESVGSAPGSGGGEVPTSSEELEAYVRRIVGPHLVPSPDPERRAALDRLDRTMAETMRSVLHDPAFQAVEAAWRTADFAARRIETDRRLKLALLDVSAETLRRDLEPGARLEASGLHRVLVEEAGDAAGGVPWALVVGLHRFGPSDAGLLGRLARLARVAGAPFLGGASLELAGLAVEGETLVPREGDGPEGGDGEAWYELRGRPEARWLGLALPRFLLRPPFGEATRPCEALPFEEAADGGPLGHEDYLWGSPACACAVLLARSFAAEGWRLRPVRHRDLERLPLHAHGEGAEAGVKPSAEFRMTERVASGLLERGFMPLAWMKGRPSARLVRFQSVSRPPSPLAGRWSGG